MLFNRQGSMKGDVATVLSRGVDSQWKKYTKADCLACDKRGNTAGQAQGKRVSEKVFQIKTPSVHLGKPGGKVTPTHLPTHSKTSCVARLFIKKTSEHQLSAVPHQ